MTKPIDAELVNEHKPEVPKRPELFVRVWRRNRGWDSSPASCVLPKITGDVPYLDFRLPAEGEKPEMPECVREFIANAEVLVDNVTKLLDAPLIDNYVHALDAVRAHFAEEGT